MCMCGMACVVCVSCHVEGMPPGKGSGQGKRWPKCTNPGWGVAHRRMAGKAGKGSERARKRGTKDEPVMLFLMSYMIL